VLNGREGGEKERERISPKIFSGSSHPLCPGATGQGFGLGCERGQREMEWQPALVLLLVGLQGKERKRERKEGIGAFGRNSIEFENSNPPEKEW
jgi:hypothetical protein